MSTTLTLFGGESLERLYKACATLSKSKMIPVSLQGKQEDIFAILVMGNEIGIHPMQALQNIHVIQGKPTISPQLMMAMIRGKIPGCIIDIKQNPATQVVTCKTARSKVDLDSGLYYEAAWDMKRAEAMGLAIKDNYKKQPKVMLTWRAVAESCRMTFPDVILGLYVPEEFQDFDGNEVRVKSETQSMIDADFPIPPEEKEVGDLYRVQNGKFRGKQLKDIQVDDIENYREELIKRTTPKKEWELELVSVFTEYLQSLNTIEV